MRTLRSLLLVLSLLAPAAASAQDGLREGTILVDDDVVELPLSLRRGRSRVVLETHSYRGGEDSQGQAIPAGGFDPVVAVYDDAGRLVATGDDVDEPGNDLDARLVLKKLAAGDYTVTVTQFNNFPPMDLDDAFDREGQGNFTADAFGDGTGQFWDLRGNPRDGDWALDVLGAGCGEAPRDGCTAPEEGSAALVLDASGKAVWKWSNGPRIGKKRFGKPRKKTDYNLCVYEDESLALALDVRAGGRWKRIERGYRYKKRGGNPDGVAKVKLVGGGSPRLRLKAKNGPAAPLPFDGDAVVTAQLVSGEGRCWEGIFDDPSVNAAAEYRAATP